MTTSRSTRTWAILRQRLVADVLGLPVVWLLFLLAVAVLVGVVALLRGGIAVSGWEQASQLARWYAGAIGVYLTAVYLPLYIAHGCTRREFARQLPVFIAAFAAMYALVMTAGYAVESVAYGLFDWSQTLTGTHLFDQPTQYALVFTEFLVLGAVWTVAGAMLGGAFYRNPLLGFGLLPLALVMVSAVEAAAGPRMLGPIPGGDLGWVPGLDAVAGDGAASVAALAAAGAVLLGLALVWAVVRDLPIRTKRA